MDVLTSETCRALNNKIKRKWHQAGLSLFNYQDDARSNKCKIKPISSEAFMNLFLSDIHAFTETKFRYL